MKTIDRNDIVFATAKTFGTINADLRLSGIGSVDEAIKAIKSEIGAFTGLVRISLRNATQGWSENRSLYLA